MTRRRSGKSPYWSILHRTRKAAVMVSRHGASAGIESVFKPAGVSEKMSLICRWLLQESAAGHLVCILLCKLYLITNSPPRLLMVYGSGIE